jgi:hypothetical protein
MEDYLGASVFRKADVDVLLGSAIPRCVAATHIGGVAIECKMKSLIAKYHRIAEWLELGARPKDPMRGQPINNPGHSLVGALRLMPDLYRRARADYLFLEHLAVMMCPLGNTTINYIDLRYRGSALGGQSLADWKRSYTYVLGWLEKNGSAI